MTGSKKRAKRGDHEGTFEQLKNGDWVCYTKIQGRKIRGKPAATKKQASDNLRTRIKEVENENDTGLQSFTTWAHSWLKRRRGLSDATKQTYGIWINGIAKQPLGSIPVGKITETDLRQWWDSRTVGTINAGKRLGFIHQLMRSAGNHASYKPPKKERHSRRPLGAEEVALLKAAALKEPDERIRNGIFLTMEGGLRLSEAAGLMHEDRVGDAISLKRTVVRVTGKIVIRSKGKTAASLAWIPLPESLLNVVGNGKGFVLGTASTPIFPDDLRDGIKRVAKAAGLDVPYMGPHALRRTFGMTLLESGVDVVTAAELMRHDPKMLLDEYSRSRRDLKNEAMKRAFGTPKDAKKEAI